MIATDILIVGAGPAGIAAAVCASHGGKQVTVLDDNLAEGGQIWRGGKKHPVDSDAGKWFRRLTASGANVLASTRVIGGDPAKRILTVETDTRAFVLSYRELILATGARELFLPFPGWTLPNVTGVGGIQALVKSGLPVSGKRIVVAGTGPLLLAVADYLRKHGASVPLIAEQADWESVARFGMQLSMHPDKLLQAMTLKASLGGVPYRLGSWIVSAEGQGKLSRVQVRTGSEMQTIECDYLAVAYGFAPNAELPQFFGCAMEAGYAVVDHLQRTSIPGISCAGEVTGLGGVDLSLIEGQVAGYAAAGREDLASNLFPTRQRTRRFAARLNRAFALRQELRRLPCTQTIVCRCEDVPYGKLQTENSWRAAKLHLRCGMGPCQGRVCGPAVSFLFGWNQESVRPPVFPARVASLLSASPDLRDLDLQQEEKVKQ